MEAAHGATASEGNRDHELTTMTQVTVDGVMQGNGGPDEDRSDGFERGGWARPLFDNETMAFIDQTYQRADAFLRRRTYELFAGSWGVREDLGNPVVRALNTRPKYVASTTLTDPKWSDTTVLSGDLAAAIGELKAKPGGELQVHGSGTLIRWLLENDLVDEMTLIVFPVVLGQGARLFPERPGPGARPGRVASSKGVTIQVYRPAGRPQYATTEVRDDADRSQPRVPERPLKEIRAAVSDRGSSVRSRGERPPTRGPNDRR